MINALEPLTFILAPRSSASTKQEKYTQSGGTPGVNTISFKGEGGGTAKIEAANSSSFKAYFNLPGGGSYSYDCWKVL